MSESINQQNSGSLKSALAENLHFMDYKTNENKISEFSLLHKQLTKHVST